MKLEIDKEADAIRKTGKAIPYLLVEKCKIEYIPLVSNLLEQICNLDRLQEEHWQSIRSSCHRALLTYIPNED